MILIRKAETADAAGIAHVQVESWRTTYAGIVPQAHLDSLNAFARVSAWEELIQPDSCFFVAERDGQVVGFITGGPIRDPLEECDAELYAIYLLEQEQRSRIGSDLLRELARLLTQKGFRSMDVWVLAANPSKQFYLRKGAHYAASKTIEIGGAKLIEEAYVWPDLEKLAERV